MIAGVPILKRMKGVRIASVTAVLVAGSLFARYPQTPVNAAAQTATDNTAGAKSYAEHCAICHGDQREGILPAFPPLLGISHQMSDDKITDFIHAGKGRMPGFPAIQNDELTALVHFLAQPASGAAAASSEESGDLVKAGSATFHQSCAFCHGRDAMGGETGPDLTSSKLVKEDKTGDKIATVVREGRPGNKMPAFNFSSDEIKSIIAFIHFREAQAAAHPGGRRGVSVEDLQTGNVEAGRKYFEGTGGCVKCHSPSGDLAHVATRYEGLKLERRMLYPEDAKSTVIVTLPSGEKVSGTLTYRDEFTISLRDANGTWRSWPTNRVRYSVDSPVDAHVKLFPKYTDDDIHNLMAYLQTLR
jgi:mono/diheme cytochrome c family protein